MPWRPLPGIAFAIATHPFKVSSPSDLPLELGDELYIIEEGGKEHAWLRGYLVSPPSLLAGLTSVKGQPLEARVYSGIFPRSCVEIREILGSGYEGSKSNGSSNGITDKDNSTSHDLGSTVQHSNGSNVAGSTGSMMAKPPAPVPMMRIGEEAPTLASEPLVDEIAYCLREWHSTNLHGLLLSRNYKIFDKLSRLVTLLDTSRRQLLHGVLTDAELSTLREKVVWDLVSGNKMLGNEVVVRDPKQRGRLLVGSDNLVEMAKLQATMSLLDKPLVAPPDKVNLHHLMAEVKDFTGEGSENLSVLMHLGIRNNQEPLSPLTESFAMDFPTKDQLSRALASGKLRTLYPNLTASDVGAVQGAGTSLFLIVRVMSYQNVVPNGAGLARSGTVRDNNAEITSPTSASSGKAGRRSLMWGSSKSRQGSQTTRLDGLQEKSPSSPSPPPTATSRPETRGRDQSRIKRAVGAAILPLEELLTSNRDEEHDLPVWTNSVDGAHLKDDLDVWDSTIEEICRSQTGSYSRLKSLTSLKIRLVSFINSDADELIRTTPTLLHDITSSNKMGFSGAPTKRRSDIYLTIREPRLPDGAVFSHPERGFLQLGKSLEMQNLQLTLEVRKSTGERIDDCIFPSSDAKPVTAWRSVATSRDETWEQSIRLAIPDEDVPSAHLIMSVADAPNFPFALCWMPLWTDGAFISDGPHSPLLHIYDRYTSNTQNGRGAYLDLPWDSRAKETLKFESVAGPMATLSIESHLCSTVFSQNKILLGILHWREQDSTDLMTLLRQLSFVPEMEIVNHTSDLLDALFAILVDQSGRDDFEDLVFGNLVTVLGIVYDRRFNLGPLVKGYADTRFKYPFATPCLIRSFLRLLTSAKEHFHARQLRSTLKVGQHIMKFIAVARKQQVAKEASIGVTNTRHTFNRDLKEIFAALQSQMRDQSPQSIGNKTLLVQHIHTWLPELYACFSENEVMDMTIGFVDACDNVQGKLIMHRLAMICNILQDCNDLGLETDVAHRFKSRLYGWLDQYWGSTENVDDQYRSQVRLCCSILSQLDGKYGSDTVHFYVKILKSYQCISKNPELPDYHVSLPFQDSYPFQTRQIETLKDHDVVLTELASLRSTITAANLIQHLDVNRPDLTELLMISLEVDMSILNGEAFPRSWLTSTVSHHRLIFDVLQGLSQVLIQNFLPYVSGVDETTDDDAVAKEFNTELWKQYLLTILKLVRSDILALENFADQKRRAVWKIGGDIREKGASLLATVWDALAWDLGPEIKDQYGMQRLCGYQCEYITIIAPQIVELCLSVHGGLRRVAIEILKSMVVGEWFLEEDLAVLHTSMIGALDGLFKEKQIVDTVICRTFLAELTTAFSTTEGNIKPDLWEAIQHLIANLDQLFELLVAAHAPEQEETSRIKHTLELMEFLKGMSNEELFVRYVHHLADVEAEAKNYTEAGLALRLHADLYKWDPTDSLAAIESLKMPKQSSFERKEALYIQMISHFEESGAWEPAVAAHRELAHQYETSTFDFAKLARIQRSVARLYDKIARGETNAPRYYRVIYSGMGFPVHLRDKAFIFEGSGSERMGQFTDRLRQQYPSAKLIGQNEMGTVEGQFLQVTTMTPHRDLYNPLYQRQKVSHSTKEYLSSINTCRFSLTTRRHAPKTGVKDQWVEKTVYTTAEAFPTILRRSEIIAEEVVSLAPLETALERTLRKLYELSILDRRAGNGDKTSIYALTDAIRTSVDPSSNSSVAKYRDLLPVEIMPTQEEPEPAPLQPLEIALRTALFDFASTIKHSLGLLQQGDQSLEHRTLNHQFFSTFRLELALMGPVQQTSSVFVPHEPTSLATDVPKAPVQVDGFDASKPSISNRNSGTQVKRVSAKLRKTQPTATTIMTTISSPTSSKMPRSPLTNGHSQDLYKASPIQTPTSAPSSRPSVHEKRKDSRSMHDREDDFHIHELKRPNVPPTPESFRPDTSHSAVTQKSGRSTKKTGSIRKRLSTTFALGSKKSPRGPMLGDQGGVTEE